MVHHKIRPMPGIGATAERKTIAARIEWKSRGGFAAVFSTFNVIDSDGDVTEPGAFEEGAEVVVSAYGHGSWGNAPPIGKARIRTTATEAIADGRLFTGTGAGREALEMLRELGPMAEWSFGYDVLESEPGEWGGRRVRILKRLKVYEVSPVLRGAGVNTRTLAVDGGDDKSVVLSDIVAIGQRLAERKLRDELAGAAVTREWLRFRTNTGRQR